MAKRSNGEGSYRKLKSGSWLGQIMDGYKPNGKKNVISVTAPTKSEAQQKIRQYLADKESGKVQVNGTMPFSTWADTWYADYKTQVQPSTYSNYKYTMKTVKEYFGATPLCDIHVLDVNKFLTFLLDQGYSKSKISKCKAMLIQIFNSAEDNNMIMKNPAIRAKTIRDLNSDEKNNKDAFTNDEVQILVTSLPDTLLGNSIRLLLGTGIRVQELLALKPEDILNDGAQIRVNKAIKMVDGQPVIGPPKSKKSRRMIPVPEDYQEFARKVKSQGGNALIWTANRADLLCSISSFRRKYYKALEQLPEVRKLSPHSCRHTYITHLEAKGVPMQLISRLAGHSSTDTTIGYTPDCRQTKTKS